ncbi:MAG: ABC transporter substrate-binding protein [Deltaproteobacteria bacterium]
MKVIVGFSAVLTVAGGLFGGVAEAGNAATEKPIKRFVNAVRYNKDALALKQVDGDAQGRVLLGDAWAKGSKAQQQEFIKLFHRIFSASAFPRLRDNLSKIETIVYADPKKDGRDATVTSTLVLLHPLKKEEIKVHYLLTKSKKGYRLVDVTFEGDRSLLTNVREDQIKPLFAEGGWSHVLEMMRARVKQLDG